MLSEPLAFAYAGWIGGSLLLIAYGLITCYTSVLSRYIHFAFHILWQGKNSGRRNGGWSANTHICRYWEQGVWSPLPIPHQYLVLPRTLLRQVLSLSYVLVHRLTTSPSVVLVTLYGDSLHEIWPKFSSETYKIVGLIMSVAHGVDYDNPLITSYL